MLRFNYIRYVIMVYGDQIINLIAVVVSALS